MSDREELIRVVAQAMHDCTNHPDYPAYDEAPCCGTPVPAMGNGVDAQFHREMNHEKGSRGICWSCEPLAASAVDALLPLVASHEAVLREDIAMEVLAPIEALADEWETYRAYWESTTREGHRKRNPPRGHRPSLDNLRAALSTAKEASK